MTTSIAGASGTFKLGGDLEVNRLGYGAMQMTGDGVWGPPADHDGALAVLRAAVGAGVDFIDTADSYGPVVTERLIVEALHPYPDDLVIATKAGLTRTGPESGTRWGAPNTSGSSGAQPAPPRGGAHDLIQLHRVDPEVPLADQVGAFAELQKQGKVRHIGLSEVDVYQLEEARTTAKIAGSRTSTT